MASPEALLIELAGDERAIHDSVAQLGPMIVPFGALSALDGWHVDLTSTEGMAAFDPPTEPAEHRATGALLVAVDYAVRRGAESVQQVVAVLNRESPVGITGIPTVAVGLATAARRAGIDSARPSSFDRRARGHDLVQPLDADPVVSFEEHSMDMRIGDNSLSSFAVHPEGEQDQVRITGDLAERWGVEVGLPPGTPLGLIDTIEPAIAQMPSFMHGLSSDLLDSAIVLGWNTGEAPIPAQIGKVIQAWTKALFDLEFADVRIVFAPSSGRSAILTDMRARAKAYRLYRDAVRSGHPDPAQVIADYQHPHEGT